jgi:uncharacterized protein involved in exopolysaccharide biosynthesis
MENTKTEKQTFVQDENFGVYEKEEEINVLKYVDIILKRRWLIVQIFIISVTLAVGIALLLPKTYVAVTTILPSFEQTGRLSALSELSGLASSFGIGRLSDGNPTALYPEILRSRTFVETIAKKKFKSEEFNEPRSLIEILEIEGDTEAEDLDIAYKSIVKGIMQVSLDKKTNILTLKIETEEPQLSADVANAFIEELNRFNIEVRTSKAKENRIFIEKRLDEAKDALKKAEVELKKFREQNRRIESSPELQLEYGRLLREVKIQEEIFITLTKEYELAKIDEKEDTPVINVLDKAIPPVHKEKPKRRKIVMIAGMLGLFGGISWVLLLGYLENFRKEKVFDENMQGIIGLRNDFENVKSFIEHKVLKK